jgi:hypothetical protein
MEGARLPSSTGGVPQHDLDGALRPADKEGDGVLATHDEQLLVARVV